MAFHYYRVCVWTFYTSLTLCSVASIDASLNYVWERGSYSLTHTQSHYASLTDAVDLMRVVIFAVLCYTTPQSSTHQHKPLWRLSGGREGKREGRHLCSQSSFEDGCYSDQPQICQLMKGRHSAVDGTHTHARALHSVPADGAALHQRTLSWPISFRLWHTPLDWSQWHLLFHSCIMTSTNQETSLDKTANQSEAWETFLLKQSCCFFYIRRLSLIKVMATFFPAVVFVCSCGEVVAAFLVVTH